MAERLLQAFERQGDHRRQMDEKTLILNFRLARVGQVVAPFSKLIRRRWLRAVVARQTGSRLTSA